MLIGSNMAFTFSLENKVYYCFKYTQCHKNGTLANSVDPDEIPHFNRICIVQGAQWLSGRELDSGYGVAGSLEALC